MEKSIYKSKIYHVLVIIIVVSLGIVSFALCIASEFKKSKKKELRLDGELCYLPQSQAFGYGIAALICLSISQILGSCFFVFGKSNSKSFRPSIASILFFLSWMSFVIVVIVIGTATSINRRQDYGEGWLDGKCYLVKDGVYVGSGMVILLTISSMLVSCIVTLNKGQVEHRQRVHAQAK